MKFLESVSLRSEFSFHLRHHDQIGVDDGDDSIFHLSSFKRGETEENGKDAGRDKKAPTMWRVGGSIHHVTDLERPRCETRSALPG
jgi:hypothetical protein